MIRDNIFRGVINHADVSKWYSLRKSVPTLVVISLDWDQQFEEFSILEETEGCAADIFIWMLLEIIIIRLEDDEYSSI